MPDDAPKPLHFIEQIIEGDAASGKWGAWPGTSTPRVHTRFPPEPNGYLHVGHAKSIGLNFGLAAKYGGKFNLRFDDTNPVKEEQEYVDSIIRDVKWITSAFGAGSFDEGPHAGGLFFASNYFQRMYDYAEDLIQKGRAYVCDLSGDEVSARRGKPGVPATSPFRDRPIEESLRLFREMRAGKHPNGSKTLRAKIDLASPNFNLRDPVMYRILHESHHNTGDAWCLYPMYDWAHGLEDSIEGITHSICTLEFEDHRPLYDWFIDALNDATGNSATNTNATNRDATVRERSSPASTPTPAPAPLPDGRGSVTRDRVHHPRQIEFAKFRPTYTVLSKRNLLKMVQEKIVSGWDDPRMPTISALRRRGYTPQAIRACMEDVGVTKVESMIDVGRIENAVRDHLNKVAPRAMAVLRPLKVVIDNWPEGKVDELDFVVNPEDASAGKRKIAFSKVIYIEREDFMETPPKKFFRLAPGQEVRLRWAYFITCTSVVKDAGGNIAEIHCTYDPATRGGDVPLGPDGKPTKKVKGTIHWVSAAHAIGAEVRLFDRLFTAEEPGKRTGNWADDLNPNSLEVVTALVDPWLATAATYDATSGEGAKFQFERLGYFAVDRESALGSSIQSGTGVPPVDRGGTDAPPVNLVFNRTVTLKDTWAKEAGRE